MLIRDIAEVEIVRVAWTGVVGFDLSGNVDGKSVSCVCSYLAFD